MTLAPNIIKYPTQEEKEETANYFLREKGFPNVIGIILYLYISIHVSLEMFYLHIL